MPKISVIIPTYNRSKYIVDTIESVLAQDFAEYEIVVVDDGSTDNTRDLLLPYKSEIRYIYQENKGVSGARNTGIRNAKGEWFAFLDSDDIWFAEKLSRQYNNIKGDGVIYFHRCEWFVDHEYDSFLLEKCSKIHWPKTNNNNFVLDPALSVAKADPYMTPSIFCHRSCFNKIGNFAEFLTAGEDEDWLSRAALEFDFLYLPDVLAKIRYHQGQTGLNSEKSVKSLIVVFERMSQRYKGVHPEAYRVARVRLANKISHYANLCAANGKKYEAFACCLRSYFIKPVNFKRLLKSLFFLLGWKNKSKPNLKV